MCSLFIPSSPFINRSIASNNKVVSDIVPVLALDVVRLHESDSKSTCSLKLGTLIKGKNMTPNHQTWVSQISVAVCVTITRLMGRFNGVSSSLAGSASHSSREISLKTLPRSKSLPDENFEVIEISKGIFKRFNLLWSLLQYSCVNLHHHLLCSRSAFPRGALKPRRMSKLQLQNSTPIELAGLFWYSA
jgi:hypothetical protein